MVVEKKDADAIEQEIFNRERLFELREQGLKIQDLAEKFNMTTVEVFKHLGGKVNE